MHQWRLRRAAPQHREVAVNGSNGPFVSFDTKGGEPGMKTNSGVHQGDISTSSPEHASHIQKHDLEGSYQTHEYEL
jgi:hypothetical protein